MRLRIKISRLGSLLCRGFRRSGLKEKVVDHLARQDRRRSIYIPEFDETIYFSPIGIVQFERVAKLAKVSVAEASVALIIAGAEDARGRKIFSAGDSEILKNVEFQIIARIAGEMAKNVPGGLPSTFGLGSYS